jgi:hypothetical protein
VTGWALRFVSPDCDRAPGAYLFTAGNFSKERKKERKKEREREKEKKVEKGMNN